MNLLSSYLNVNSILILFIVIFAFIVIRQLIIGFSKSHFKNVFMFLIFVIGILSIYARQYLLGILFILFGFTLIIGMHFIGDSKNENKE